jgi:hypothetical protein
MQILSFRKGKRNDSGNKSTFEMFLSQKIIFLHAILVRINNCM